MNPTPKPGPWTQFFRVLLLIFATEALVMFVVAYLGGNLRPLPRALLDSLLLSLLVTPFLWWWLVSQEKPRRQAELALRSSERKFRRMFEGSADALLLLDLNSGRFTDCNQATVTMLGCARREEVINLLPAELSPPRQPDGQPSETKAPVMIALAMRQGSHRFEWTHRSAHRPDFPVEVLLTPIELEGPPTLLVTWRDITERKQAESRLQLVGSALEAAANAIVITDRAGLIEWVNPAFTRVTGYTPGEAVGRTPGDLLRSGKHDAAFFQNLWSTILSGGVWQGEIVNRRKDGSVYSEHQTITPVRDAAGAITHFIGIKEDVTARKQTEAQLLQQALIIDQSPVAVVVTDLAHRVVYCNRGALELYARTREDMIGHTAEEIFSGETARHLAAGRAATLATGRWSGRVPVETPTGQRRMADFHMVLVADREGRPQARLCLAVDITDKIGLEEQLMRAQRVETLGLLAAGISHDLNNLLAPVLMAAPLLRRHASHPEDIRILEAVEKSAERGGALVKQILAFARGDGSDKILLQPKHILREVGDLVSDTFPKSIRVEVDIPSELAAVEANPTQLHQVVLNLCVNARDAMPKGGTLVLRAGSRWRAGNGDGLPAGPCVLIEVTDTGIGMGPEMLARIWDPFFTTKTDGRGTGLGLATVRGIVRDHLGGVEVESAPGFGSTFRVWLPVAEGHTSDGASAGSRHPLADPGHGELVLVVDDDDSVGELVERTLGGAGYRTVSARDAESLWRTIRQSEFALVLMDLDLPGQDGLSLARILQRTRNAQRVLFITGLTDSDGFLPGHLPAGAPVLKKPFTAGQLLRAVQAALATTAFTL